MRYVLPIFILSIFLFSCSNRPENQLYGKWEYVSSKQLKPIEGIEGTMSEKTSLFYYFGPSIWNGENGKELGFTDKGEILGNYIPEIAVEKLKMTFGYEKYEDLVLIIYHPQWPKEPIPMKIPVRFEDDFMYLNIEGFIELKFERME